MYRSVEGNDHLPVGIIASSEIDESNKIPYVPSQRQSDKMTDAQKEGVRIWNLMRNKLLEYGLMEEK